MSNPKTIPRPVVSQSIRRALAALEQAVPSSSGGQLQRVADGVSIAPDPKAVERRAVALVDRVSLRCLRGLTARQLQALYAWYWWRPSWVEGESAYHGAKVGERRAVSATMAQASAALGISESATRKLIDRARGIVRGNLQAMAHEAERCEGKRSAA